MKERDKAAAKDPSPAKAPKTPATAKNQGEGDYAADRRYRERTDQFLKTTDVEEVARAAAPKSAAEAREMATAEEQGRAHAHVPAGRALKRDDKPRGGR